MATIVTHQPRPVPASRRRGSRRQRSACIPYPSSPLIPNQSQSPISFSSTVDLHPRSYRPNRLPRFPSSNHHVPHTHHPFYSHQQRSTKTAATPTASFPHLSSPLLSSTYPLVYSPSERSYQNTHAMSAEIQHEYPFDIGFATGSTMAFVDLELSQSTFLDPGRSESKSDFKVESSHALQPLFHAYPGSDTFSDSDSSPAVDDQLFVSQPQPHGQPWQSSEMLTGAPQHGMYFNPSTENEMEMEGYLDLHYSAFSPPPHPLLPSAVPTFVRPSQVRSHSPRTLSALVPCPRVPELPSPAGLTCESDEDLGSESGESEAADPSDVTDGDFMPNRKMLRSRLAHRSRSPPTFGAPVRVLGSSSPPGLTSELVDEDLGNESGEIEAADPSDVADGDFMPNRKVLRSRLTHRLRSPPAFGALVPSPRVPGSSSPPGLTRELDDEDLGSESEAADLSDVADDDGDDDFMPNRKVMRLRLAHDAPLA